MGTSLASTTLVFLVLFAVNRLFQSFRRHRVFQYPPGPPGKVFFGNFFDIPQKNPWLIYTDWAKKYGTIVHLETFSDHIFILNDLNTTTDLLEKRSRIYSGRPDLDVAASGWGFNLTFHDYGDRWRKNRRVYQQHLRPDAVVELRPIIRRCLGVFLNNLLRNPSEFMGHIDLLALSSMYGLTIDSAHDPVLLLAKDTVHTLDTVFSTHYMFLMKNLPFMQYVPAWVPILGSVTKFNNETRKLCRDFQELPLQQVLKDIDSGSENDGIVARILRQGALTASDEEFGRIKDMAATALVASADTTLSSLGTFFMAMAKHPQCQERAWREIDAVTGGERLPNWDDRKSMPYVEAIYRDCMRWHPALPTGAVHVSTEDDYYKDYFIPKGSMVFANIWSVLHGVIDSSNLVSMFSDRSMTHDERVYADPYQFNPERYFNANGELNKDSTVLGFGFGRRVCVGKHFAEATLWLAIASVLTCFRISPEKDSQGNDIDIPERYSPGPGLLR
ncbi:cytochrome p450 [Paramarasmius palmivorus]|uniref:Cytochrome p450 n=1 Tax=Paramarasmius palmivorus TaxID=297713 RepID=A0AAW0CF55_9AGAR